MDAPSEILAELREREPIFHADPTGADHPYFDALLAEHYFEIGASGRIYLRERVIETAVDRYARGEPSAIRSVDDFAVHEIAPHTFLATYTLSQPDGHAVRVTRRSSIWSNASGRWQVVYHQGTIVEG